MNEYHVCGVLLMSRPESAALVERSIDEMSGVEIHANEGGRMVVTVEGEAYEECANLITELSTLKGVASSSLVYHEIDTAALPEESVQ